jgi:eukaryotic-like serine/threonine-protein kinase
MAIVPGRRLGPYEILSSIGAGGMGEVYRARDTRLDRIVAIKVLPTHLADRSELRERFEREARTIASLNHPHICTLFDTGHQDEIDFLVMEYLEGETLAQRLLKGSLPLEQVLQYAIEISDALDKAHRKGVTHRDLKPGNIMLTKTGTKLLDFGLAKLKQEVAPANVPLSDLPTAKDPLTAKGTIVGTLQYMAPEQLEGKEVDARTDIFAFGVVVYEMATGKKAFEGKSQASVIGAILKDDPPPISFLQPMTPPALDRVVKKCLAKEPENRWQTPKDLCDELKWIAEGGSQAGMPAPVVARRKVIERVVWAVAGVLLMAIFGLGVTVAYLYRSPGGAAAVRFFVFPPEKASFFSGATNSTAAISPDGRRLAFNARDASGKVSIWVRPLDDPTPQALQGTDDGIFPFWSPDSRTIGFFAEGKLKRIDASGGPVQTLADAPNGRGGTWNRDGAILFAPDVDVPLYRVASGGGEPALATKLEPLQRSHRFPSFLPDGRHFLYLALGGASEPSGIFLGSLDSNDSERLLAAETNALYSTSGDLLFVRQGTLLRQPFDAKKLALSGDPSAVAEHVAVPVTNVGGFSVSENGVLTYRTGPTVSMNFQFAWFDRMGKLVEAFGALGGYRGVDVSPDGKRIAVHRHDSNGGDIWLFESARRETMSRFTFDATQDNSSPIWSPDGSRIAFGSQRNGKWGIYQKSANGTGGEELLVESDLPMVPMCWSPDGKFIVYTLRDPKTGFDVWILPLGDKKPVAFLQSSFNERDPQISPNGKWIAYTSNETGRDEIYVRPFPAGEGKWQISSKGGYYSKWRRDGKELFYLETSTSPRNMISVKVNTAGPTFEYGDPAVLFDSLFVNAGHGSPYQAFAVSPDGQRFLIPRPDSRDEQGTASAPITVVLNWTAGLKK